MPSGATGGVLAGGFLEPGQAMRQLQVMGGRYQQVPVGFVETYVVWLENANSNLNSEGPSRKAEL